MVACGDREDFLQLLRIVPSLREGTMRSNCNSRVHAEALPLHERDYCTYSFLYLVTIQAAPDVLRYIR